MFEQWLGTISYMLEGPLSFFKNGINITIQSARKWEKTDFLIEGTAGYIGLPLFQHNVIFNVHRDIFQGKEWEVFMDDPE